MKPLDPRVLPHLLPARRALAVVVGGSAFGGILVVAQAFAGAGLVAGVLADPAGSAWHTAAWVFTTVTLVRAGLGWAVDSAASTAAGQVGNRLRRLVLSATLELSPTDLGRRRRGELTTLATRGVSAVEPYLTRYLPALVLAGVLPLLTLIAIASQDLLSALIVLLTLPLLPVFAILIGLATRDRADRQWRALGTLAGHFLDVVRGLPTLVTHRRAEAQVPKIRGITERYRRASADTLKLAFASSAALELIATISVALVAVAVGLRLAGGSLDLRTALVVLLLAPEAYWPIRRVGAEYHAAAEGTATFEAIHELTTTGATTFEGEDAAAPAKGAPHLVRLDDVTVAWPGREPILRGLTAQIQPLGITAVVGPSGCGKSTLLQVLLGELDLADGMIRVGAADLSSTRRTTWRDQVAHLPQRPWLIADTIAANLRLGRPDATDADLAAALTAVDLGEAVHKLPHGLGTSLGEDGLGLSAGQRARLALARVIVADRPYVLLDEPTAHLDAHTEQVMLDVLRVLAQSSTVIVVAHRDAVVAMADQVIDLETHSTTPPASDTSPATSETIEAVPREVSSHVPPELPHAVPATDPEPARTGPDATGSRWRWALVVLLATLASASGVALTATAGWLIARAAEQPPILFLTVAIVGVRTFGLARPALHYVERLLGHDLALRTLAQRRSRVFEQLIPLVPGRLGRHGDVLTGVVDDVDAHLDDLLRVRLPVATWLGVSTIAGVLAGFVLPVSVIPVLTVSLLGGSAAWFTGWWSARNHEAAFIEARADVGRRSAELVGSARHLVLWGVGDRTLAGVEAAADVLVAHAQASNVATARGRALALTFAGLGTVSVAVIGAAPLAAGTLSGPMLALLMLTPLALAEVISPLADAGALRVRTAAAEARLATLTGTPAAVVDPATPHKLPPAPHSLRLTDATISWHEDIPAVSGLSLDLRPGCSIGVTGPSGSGKSTLGLALLKLLPVTAGVHELSRTPVVSLTGDDVRRVVGLLDDDPYLFGSTLLENVRLAEPAASDLEVELVLRGAHLGDWIDGLAQGVHTRIGDGGVEVSGGERARIGLARALLAGRDILVLDEPTAHLDAATARAVARDLLAANAGRSLVWITHDQVGLDAMDHVVDLGSSAEVAARATT